MPIGIQRLNAKKTQPNPHIVFIKPLNGPDEAISQEFLEKIAAQCLPVMREHHIHVMSLEEFPANREFVGRNFNAGEVIQLVLKSPRSGRWLPFNYVQMVMMHELAHCKQMNHSRVFWSVRNQYAAQMHTLWSKGYTGDGVWGRGAKLGSGEWEANMVRDDEVLPEHLCGGTYRSRKGKRKAKPAITYQERKERRILKKFGKNGVALGADDVTKVKLEKGKRVQGKPRVAGSARGRELRAAAALARFEKGDDKKAETKQEDKGEDVDSDSASGYSSGDLTSKDATDVDGTRLVDKDGKGMVKVCEDENADDPAAKSELDELQGLFRIPRVKREWGETSVPPISTSQKSTPAVKQELDDLIKPEPTETSAAQILLDIPRPKSNADKDMSYESRQRNAPSAISLTNIESTPVVAESRTEMDPGNTTSCSTCSFTNPRAAATCAMCANVLNPTHTPDTWRCSREPCTNTTYMNSRDCGVCGLCGQKRS